MENGHFFFFLFFKEPSKKKKKYKALEGITPTRV